MLVYYQNPNPHGKNFSQSVSVDGIIYTHGQIGVSTRESKETFEEQATRSMELLLKELEAYEIGLKDVFKVNIYLTPSVDIMNEYLPWYQEAFKDSSFPIRTTVIINGVSPNPNACFKMEFVAKKR